MLSQLRQARYGYLLALHVLLPCAAGRTPPRFAAFLFGSRSAVGRIVTAYLSQSLAFDVADEGGLVSPVRPTCLLPWVKRSLLALLKASPHTCGWCRARWRC